MGLAPRLLPAVLAALSVVSSAAVQAADSGERSQVTFAPTRAVLTLIPGAEAARLLAEHKLDKVDSSSAQEADLLRECSNGEAQRSVASRSFFIGIITQTWQVLLHPLAVAVKDELAKYASVSNASASGDYYHGGEARGALSNRISCLRFTRYLSADSGDDVALDFVASVNLDSQHDAIRLRPLRLYLSQAGAKSATGHYAVAVTVRAHAVWRDEYAGHSGMLFEQTAASESIDLKQGPVLKYYAPDAQGAIRLPIVPVSYGIDRTQDFGRAEFSVSVAELGTQPATLKLLAEMLPDPEQKMSGTVIAAAIVGQIH